MSSEYYGYDINFCQWCYHYALGGEIRTVVNVYILINCVNDGKKIAWRKCVYGKYTESKYHVWKCTECEKMLVKLVGKAVRSLREHAQREKCV